jgi:hypothetical protein
MLVRYDALGSAPRRDRVRQTPYRDNVVVCAVRA